MEIISGERKGHKIKFPVTPKIRPTSSNVREAIFNVLAARNLINGARVLDLYCGVGSLGLEALSRGASFVCFVDRGELSIKYVKENLEKLHYSEKARVIKNSSLSAINKLYEEGEKFDLIFADPPYNVREKELSEVFKALKNVLKKNGVVVLEHSSKNAYNFDGYHLELTKKYGDTAVSFYLPITNNRL